MRRLISLLLLLIPTILFAQASWNVVTVPYRADNLNFFTGNGSTYFNVTLTGNVNTSGLNGGSVGMETIFNICQDNVGGRTFNWPPNVVNPPTISPVANACSVARFVNVGNFTWNNTGGGSGGGVITVSSLPALPCTTGQQVFLNTNTAFGQGLYNCLGGNWYLAVSGTTNTFYATGWGVKADGYDVHDATWTNTLNTVTCPNSDCNFVAGTDNGKLCWGIDINTGTATLPVGTLTVTGANAATCSTATGSKVANGNFAWCSDDTAAWQALRTAYYASQRAAFIIGPGGKTCTTKAPLLDTRGNVIDNVRWQASFQTPDAMTIFVAPPNFDFTTCGTVVGGDGGCFWDTAPTGGTDQQDLPQYNKLHNFGVTGLGFTVCGIAGQSRKLVAFRRTEGSNIWLWNWCEDSTTIGANMASPNSVDNLNLNEFGSTPINITGGTSNAVVYLNNSYVGQQSFNLVGVQASANLVSKGNFYLGCSGQCIVISAGGTMVMDGDQLFGASGNQYVDVAGTLYVTNNTQITASNNAGHAILTRATGKVVVRDSVVKETGTSGIAFNVNLVPGGTIINAGNNTLVGTDQTALTASMIVLSAGWGNGPATVTNLTGTPSSHPTRFSFQVNSIGAGQAANPTMAFTYPNVGSTPTWTCKQVGGTGALTTISGEGTATSTTMTLTFNGTPVAGSNYVVTCTGALQ